MAVIGIINQKGGCGKSTTSVHLAYWLQKLSKTVLVIDADAQQSSSSWLSGMNLEIPFKVVSSPDDLLEQIPALEEANDFLVVDGPASLSEVSRAILFRSDLAIVPCQPTDLDLRSASEAVRLIQQAQSVRNGPPKATLFLNRAVKGTRLKDEALSLLHKLQDVEVLKSVIHQKQVVADSSGQSATVWDLKSRPASESAREFDKLFNEVISVLP